MLTRALLEFTLVGAEWVLWLLLALSVLSLTVMIERAIYFVTHGFGARPELLAKLRRGELEDAKALLGEKQGLVPDVVRAGIENADRGPEAVEHVLASEMARSKSGYDRFLAFLGTLGNNAPFIGLFGTVLGIIRAFADLAAAHKGGTEVVMAGISEALVATAVGLFVAIPSVVAFNVFARRLKRLSSDAVAAGQALLAGLRGEAADEARADKPRVTSL